MVSGEKSNNNLKKLSRDLEKWNIKLTCRQEGQFIRYYELLTEWNRVMNLTAITEFDEVMKKHFVDSLSLQKAIPDLGEKTLSLIDVGTGAGFPGIPLKIVFPSLKITLLDSLQKRVKFLHAVIEETGLTEIEAVHGRAEDLARGSMRENYDVCVSRAVANLSTLCEYCLPFVRQNGMFVPYKTDKVKEELEGARKAVYLLGGKIEEQYSFLLPDSDIERTLVKIRKTGVTSSKYPRKAGLPAKEPIV